MIDLHVHSTASDGSVPPAELPVLAAEKHLTALALTDHDTVSGLPDFLDSASKHGIRGIPGVEISTFAQNRDIHIVGLFIDPASAPLLELLSKMRDQRKIRNAAILLKLQARGYQITNDELLAEAGGESVGRPHIAAILVRKGYFKTPQDVFDQLLKRGRSMFVARIQPPPERAIAAIHQAGGLAVWAHPASGMQSGERAYIRKTLRFLVPAGLDGIEARYSTFAPKQSQTVDELAAENHLLRSGGSDFHGTAMPGIQLGTGGGMLAVPDEFLEMMDSFRREKQNGTVR